MVAAPTARGAEVVRSRVPAVLVVLTPPGKALTVPLSSVIEAASEAARWHTDLELRSPEQAGVATARLAACDARQRMTCWARAARTDLAAVGAANAIRFIVVVVGRPVRPGIDRLNTLLIDLDAASLAYRSAVRTDPDWRDRVEDEIFRATAQGAAVTVDTRQPEALAAYFEDVVQGTLRDKLAEKGHWWPCGRLRVVEAPPGLALEIDGQPVGATGNGTTEIAPIQAGLRDVVVRGPQAHEVRASVEVRVGGEATVQWEGPPDGPHVARSITRWGGLGVVAIGAVVAGIGWARAGDVETTCIRRTDDASCPEVGAITVGFDPDEAPSTDPSQVNPSGVQLSSLGLALMTSGAAWSAGAWWLGEESSPPWWAWLAGLVVGSATYAVAAAVQ